MYICDVCHQTYHWTCTQEFGCYTDEQRRDIDNNDYWACPACAHLKEMKNTIENQALPVKNFVRVAWEPSWEPEDIKEI
eukprot:1154513-Pelagomonas_calceolata.AAC.4